MRSLFMKAWQHRTLLITGLLLVAVVCAGIFFFGPSVESWWSTLRRESRRILGGERGETPPEEKRIREEVILKKMDEVSAQRDWRDLAPEYPRLKKVEPVDEKERLRVFKESPELKEVERDLKEYLMKKEDSFDPELPIPSLKEATDLTRLKDKGTERVIERLLSSKERVAVEKPLEENLQLGMKGPLASRNILERPQPPQVKVKVATEIELTLWVLPNGAVDRIIPSVRGEAELERIAIQYLKQWQFVPLPRDQVQVEQWGTIPIKFRLQ
jgi:TonB family protein